MLIQSFVSNSSIPAFNIPIPRLLAWLNKIRLLRFSAQVWNSPLTISLLLSQRKHILFSGHTIQKSLQVKKQRMNVVSSADCYSHSIVAGGLPEMS